MGTLSATPNGVGYGALRDDPEACRARLGNYVVQRLLVGDVDTQLDRLEIARPYGPERCRPIAGVANKSNLARIFGSQQSLDNLSALE
jgi:hypothetical protein